MGKFPVCVRSVTITKKVEQEVLYLGGMEYALAEVINQVRPYMIDFELTSRCQGACAYCFASSDEATDIAIPEIKDNIYKESLVDIFERGRDRLLFNEEMR